MPDYMLPLPDLLPDDQDAPSPVNLGEPQKPEPASSLPDLMPDTPDIAGQNSHLTRDVNPDQAREAKKMGDSLGMAPGLAYRNREDVRNLFAISHARSSLANAPGTTAALQDVDRFGRARDDLDNLAGLERAMRGEDAMGMMSLIGDHPKNAEAQATVAETGKALLGFIPKLAVGVNDSLSLALGGLDNVERNLGRILGTGSTGIFGDVQNWVNKNSNAIQKDWLESEALAPTKDIADKTLLKNPELIGKPSWWIRQIGDLAPIVGTAALTGGVTGTGALGAALTEGSIWAGGFYRDLLNDGVDKDTALTASMIFGAAATGLGKVQFNALMGKDVSKLAGPELEKWLTEEAGVSLRKRFARTVFSGGKSAAAVWAAGPVEAFIGGIAKDKSPDQIAADVANAAKSIDVLPVMFLMGAWGGMKREAGTAGMVAEARERDAIKRLLNTQQAAESADGEQAMLQSARTWAAQSKVRAADPAEFEAIVQAQLDANKSAPESAFISGEAFAREVPDSTFARLGVTREAVAEAAETGGDVAVPFAKYLAYLAGTDVDAALVKDIRTSVDSMSIAERDAWVADSEAEARRVLDKIVTDRDARAQADADFQRIYDAEASRLKAMPKGTRETATSNAAVVGAFYSTLAARGWLPEQFKGSAWEAYRHYNPDVATADAGVELGGGQAGMVSQYQQRSAEVAGADFNDPRILMQGQEKSRGMTQFDTPSGRPIIGLFEKADQSTFLHESGHVFLEVLRDLASRPDAAPELADTWAGIKEELGIKSDAGISRESHEKWAQALEMYFREGKAPSTRLASAFQKFAAWLRSLYTAFTAQKVQPSPELSKLFDTIFATDAEMAEVEAAHEASKPFIDAAADQAQEESFRKYQRLRAKAQEDSRDSALKRYTEAYIQALGGKGKFREEAQAQANAMPVYAAMDEAVGSGGLDAGAVDALLGVEDRKALSKKRPGMVRTEGGMNPDALAEAHGYDSAAAMLRDMMQAEGKGKLVKRMSDEAMAAREQEIAAGFDGNGDLVDYHGESRLAVLAAEAEMLRAKLRRQGTRQQAVDSRAVREVARRVLADKPIGEAIRYSQYSRAEIQAAKDARKALGAGNEQDALLYKNREMLNHALVLESIRAKQEYEATTRRFRRAMNRNIDGDYMSQVVNLLHQYGFTDRTAVDTEAPALSVFMGKHGSSLDPDAPFYSGGPVWPAWLLDGSKAGEKHKKNLTVADLADLNSAVHWLVETGYDVKHGRMAVYKESLKEKVAALIAPALGLKDWGKPRPNSKNTMLRALTDDVRQFIADHNTLTTIFDEMDGFSNVGPGGHFGPNRGMALDLADRQNQRDRMRKESAAALAGPLDILGKGAKRFSRMLKTDVPVPEAIARDGGYWTYEMAVAVALNLGNETNAKRLVDGYGLPLEQFTRLVGETLTRQELDAVQVVLDHVETYWPELSRQHYAVNHFRMPKVEARPLSIQLADGTTYDLRGGYYPLKYDGRLSSKAAHWTEKDDLMNQSVSGHPGVADGMTKARVEGKVSLPVALDMGVLYRHVEESIHYITHADLIKDLDRLTRDPEYKRVMEDKLGREVYQTIRPALKYIARPDQVLGLMIDRKLDKMRALATAYILGLNFSVAAKQAFSLPGAINDIGAGAYVKGVMHVLQNPIEGFHAMHELSPFMESRSRSLDRDMKDQMGAIGSAGHFIRRGTLDAVRDWSFALIRMVDFLTVYPIWWGAQQKGMDQFNGDMRKAVQYADEMVRQSQPSSKPMDLSALQRNRNGYARLFSMFMSFTSKYGNRQRYYWRGWREGKISTAQFARFAVMEAIAPPLLMNLMFTTLWGKQYDPEDAAVDALLYQFAGYAFLRDAAGLGAWGVRKLMGKDSYKPDLLRSPALEGVKIAQRSLESLINASATDDWEKAAWAFADLACFGAGVPVSKVARTMIEGIRQYEDEDGTPFNILIPDPEKRKR